MLKGSHYIGTELELFQRAINWKNYYRKFIMGYIKGDVLEVGAGIGATTAHLATVAHKSWLCLEPDADLASAITTKISNGELPETCDVIKGTTGDLPAQEAFDTILYIDVIEHIQDDADELQRAYKLLRKGGHLIILVPAHQFLFSNFDKAIGHYRRYNKKMLLHVVPPALEKVKLIYLDSLGLSASFLNKLLLKQQVPTPAQIQVWDKVIVEASKITDKITGYSIGKSLVGVWKKK